MNIYLAGTSVSNPSEELELQKLFKQGHKLHSYYHIPILEKNWFEMNTKNKVELFLDSGAFSAWTQGTSIDLDQYIQFIRDHEDSIHIYANLDVISIDGKKPGRDTATATYENQVIMEEAGLQPLPCFHFGEPMEFLERYVRDYDYLALGVAGVKGKQLIPWLNKCFSEYICDENGLPKVKVHGFAITSLKIMSMYPWWSVDSTSWVVTGRMGGLFIPKCVNGKLLYNEKPWKIMVSTKSPGTKVSGKHITTVSPQDRAEYINYIENAGYKLGKSVVRSVRQSYVLRDNEQWFEKKPKKKEDRREVETVLEPGVSNTYQLRDELNIKYFLELEKHIPAWPWSFKVGQIGLGLEEE